MPPPQPLPHAGVWAGMNQVINQYADSVTLEDLRRAPDAAML